jgi:hypothetical protein
MDTSISHTTVSLFPVTEKGTSCQRDKLPATLAGDEAGLSLEGGMGACLDFPCPAPHPVPLSPNTRLFQWLKGEARPQPHCPLPNPEKVGSEALGTPT